MKCGFIGCKGEARWRVRQTVGKRQILLTCDEHKPDVAKRSKRLRHLPSYQKVEPIAKYALWTVGIYVWHCYAGGGRRGWRADLSWSNDLFGETGGMEGVIQTRYAHLSLSDAVDDVLEFAELFGIGYRDVSMGEIVSYDDRSARSEDEKRDDFPPPADVEALCRAESARVAGRLPAV